MITNRKFNNFSVLALIFSGVIDARFPTNRLFKTTTVDYVVDFLDFSGTTELTVEKLIQNIIKNSESSTKKVENDEILDDAGDTEYLLDEIKIAKKTTEAISTIGTTRLERPTENDPREGICKRYTKDTEHVEVSTTNVKELFTGHYTFNYSKCCFNKKIECRKQWYFTPALPYFETKQKWREIDVCCKGYERDKRRPFDNKGRLLCAPICEKPCVRSTCAAPNNCSCMPGYKKAEGNETTCIPSCKNNCGGKSNGVCVAPEACLCKRGFVYKKGEFNKCVSHCPTPCINAICNGPSSCKCLPGYKHDMNDRYKCVPVCKKGCAHGDCISPNKCVCHKGYYLVGGNCWPICNHFCGHNGTCVDIGAPFKCYCNPGYKYDTRIQECIPHCENCNASGGVCIYPNKCRCFPGFLPTEHGGCVFVCSFECGLGRCVGKDECICPKGYIFNKTAVGPKCAPYCPGCELGECIAPNNCQCPRGYVYHVPKEREDRSLRCIKTVKEFRYYDDKMCKGIYDERQRLREQTLRNKQKKIAKTKWKEERRKKYNEIVREKKKKQEKNIKGHAQKKQDKKEWINERSKDNKEKLEKEKHDGVTIRKKEKIVKKPTVIWKNFAKVAVASLFFGPFGIIFW